MILTCPECATSYFAQDTAIGSGRTVRCASCGASWRAKSEHAVESSALHDRVADDPSSMVLTCPECAASYLAPEAAIGSGRTVRCASCGHSWHAASDRVRQPEVKTFDAGDEPEPSAEAPEDIFETASEPEAQDETGAEDPLADAGADDATSEPAEADVEVSEPAASDAAADDLPKVFRARAQTERKVREAAAQGVIWAGMGASLALLVALAVVFRMDVVQLWPKAASAYASIGLTVNPVGLTIEDVKNRNFLREGRPMLMVTGVVRNIRPKTMLVPPVALLDKDHRRVLARAVLSGSPVVAPGESREFVVSLENPPHSDVWVEFLLGPRAGRVAVAQVIAPAAVQPQPPALRPAPSAVEDAAPLASGSPFTLPGTTGEPAAK